MRGGWGAAAVLVACALVLTMAIPEGWADDGDFKEKVRLRKAQLKYGRERSYVLPRGTQAVEKPVAMTARLGEKNVLFFDVDGNGSFGDVGIDGWAVDASVYRYMVPLEPSIMLDEWEVFLRFSKDGTWVHYCPEYPDFPDVDFGPTPADKAQAGAVRRSLSIGLTNWNRLRLRSGLAPVRLDRALSDACMLHSLYMDQHGVTHTEEEGKAGYTAEGAAAGRAGSVGPGPLLREIRFCHSSFYHRLMLFHPDTRRVGLGEGRKRVTLDGISGREAREWSWPVIIPAPGVHDVPRGMSDERPIPHPDVFTSRERLEEAGFPITLTFESTKITEVNAELRLGGPDGAEVPFQLSWPERPANDSQPTNFKSICLIPDRTLAAETVYWVRVGYTHRREADQRTFRFRTGE